MPNRRTGECEPEPLPKLEHHKISQVIDFKSQKRLVTREDCMELIEVLRRYIEQLRPFWHNQIGLDNALLILHEIRWCVYFNHKAREECFEELERLADELYVMINDRP